MANQSCGRRRPPVSPAPALPAPRPEPEMKRWPHPVPCAPEAECPNLTAALHFIHCSLSYQNQLLSEIRALLEGLRPGVEEEREGR